MLFDVGPLLRQPAGTTRAYGLSEHQEGSPELAPADVKGTLSLLRTSRGILVSARLSIASSDACSRCLEPLQTTSEVDFQEEYAPTVDASTGAHLTPPADTFAIDERQELDLNEAIRQYRLASQPMQPLCRPDCRGLCPDCGANLNLGPCACPSKSTDPRWAALAEIGEVRARIHHQGKG